MEKIPFRKEELQVKAVMPGVAGREIKVLSTPITPRENFLRFMAREDYLWMPTGGDFINLTPRISADNIARGFVHDALPFDNDADAGGEDMFGVEWEWVPAVGGSMVRPGNPKVKDLEEWEDYITFPDLDEWDWQASADENRAFIEQKTYPLGVTILNGMFERLISFIEMDEALMALVDEDEQDAVHRLFDRLADFYVKMIGKYKEYFDIDFVMFHDDWGSQRAPFFSIDTLREMIIPYIKRIVDGAHELGVFFELHSCGKNEMLVPAMLEAGIDMWNGQPMNDKLMLCSKYGDSFHFGCYPTTLTAQSSPEEVRETYEKFVSDFAPYDIYGGTAPGVQGARELVYELSRAARCGRAE